MTDRDGTETHNQAAHWVARMDAVDWSAALETELQAWIAADVRRRGALLQAQAAWLALDLGAQQHSDAQPRRRFLGRRTILTGGGALAASLVGGFAWLASATVYRTDIGEIRRVPLADGTIATINTASDIVVNLAAKRREVLIRKGEAWFQVAPDSARPFVVQAGRVMVQAVGTAFSVHRRDSGADILVNEGVVEVWIADVGDKVKLAAGQRAFVADAAIAIVAAAPSSVDHALAWRGGMIDLAGDTLADAITEFNRYNRRKIVLLDPRLSDEQFDGLFRADDPEGFAIAVRTSLDVPVNIDVLHEIRIGRSHG